MLQRHAGILLVAVGCAGSATLAQDVRITEGRADASFDLQGVPHVIGRIQDLEHQLTGEFARTSRACPPFCIQPAIAARGVATIGELEVIDFLENKAAAGTGLLIDCRLPDWFAGGAIPGAVNVPFATLDPTNPYRQDILLALGATGNAAALDFSAAMELILYANGPWDDQAARAVRSLLDAGYPADKLRYYRGGMQDWLMLGLTVTGPAPAQ